MPNGTKRRPDTLELEVLRAPTARVVATTTTATSTDQRYDSSDNDGLRSRCPETSLTPLQQTHARTERSEHRGLTPKERWFHFGGIFTKKSRDSNTTTSATTTANLGTTAATLAKPEPTNIDNSATTILTLSPQNVEENLPDVAAVVPRKNSKRRRSSRNKSQSGSLYSLATLAQTGEIQLHSRNDKELEAKASASSLIRKVDTKDKILLTSVDDTAGADATQSHIDLEDVMTDGINPASKSGLRANLMSFLSKLAIWKNSNCRRQQRKQSTRSKQQHPTPSGYSTGPSSSLGARKSVNISTDFEQFPAAENSEDKLGRFANAKEIGIRRLSQIRRRRSSYYYSGI